MRVLFVHQNFPGQYLHLAPALARDPGNEVVALSLNEAQALPGVRHVRYGLTRAGNTPGVHPLAAEFETKTLRAEGAARAALGLRAEGFTPDVICGHVGWGECMLLKDVWPEAKLLGFAEFNYRADGADTNFDPEFPLTGEDARFKIRVKNAANFVSYDAADWLIAPTRWQASQLPAAYHDRLSVIHDGIDTDRVRPDPRASITLGRAAGPSRPGDEIVTFVNRNLEPYRGYHTFMRALPEILRRRPKARAVLVGGNHRSYGPPAPEGKTYRDIYLGEVQANLDMSRVHFVGKLPYEHYLALLQVSAVHVYLTYPFVLSWSLIEALAAGCAVIGSDTPPVAEVIRDGENGRLTDFFDAAVLADTVVDTLARPHAQRPLREAARRTAVRDYDLRRVCLPRHLALVADLAAGRRPAA